MRTLFISFSLVAWFLAAVGAVSLAMADYAVTGKFQYEDREFDMSGLTGVVTPRPIRFADVRILSGNITLATGATSQDGTFSIFVPGSSPQPIIAICIATASATPGLLLEIRVANNDYSPGDLYSVASAPANASGSATVDLGLTTALASTDPGKVFNIWDVTIDALQFVASPQVHGSLPSEKLTMLWRETHTETNSFFARDDTSRYVYIGSLAAFNDTVISHEFGHYIDDLYSKSTSPGGTHYLGNNAQDMRLSWGEGLATFLGSSIRNYKGYHRPEIYVSTDGKNLLFSYELESLSGNALTIASKTGSTNEIAVTAALWDITDGPGTLDSTPGTEDDPMERPFGEVWKVLTQYLPTIGKDPITIETFWDGWFSPAIQNGHLVEMQTVFANLNGIEFIPDAQEPDNASSAAPLISPPQLPALARGPKVVINELEMGSMDALELYNAGDAEADLTGWIIQSSRPNNSTVVSVLPPFKLAAGSFVILSEAAGRDTRFTLYLDINIPWANGSGGACTLKDAIGAAKDFVRWGDSKEPVPPGTAFGGPNAPSPPNGQTLARDYTGSDTDNSSDWTPQLSTIGTWNVSGQERHYTYYPNGDVDYAAFSATAGKTYLLETMNLSNGADTIVDFISSDGTTVLSTNDDAGESKASRLAWTAPADGKYFIRSRRFDGRSNFARYGSHEMRLIESPSALSIPLPEILTVSQPGHGGTYERISDAVAVAANGDTVQILDAGTYNEYVSVSGKSITIRAADGKNPILDGRGLFSASTIQVSNAKSVRIDGLTLLGGSGGISIYSGAATIVNTIIRSIFNPAGYSDAIRLTGGGASASIVNCTLINNGRYGVGVFSNAALRIANSILRGNGRADIGTDGTEAVLTVNNSIVQSGALAGKDGNISGDPLFVDPANGDLHLASASPAIDKGDPADRDLPASDADGIPRSLDGGSGKPIPDMGAYEYLSPASLTSTAVFPQIAAGGANPAYETTLVAFNTAAVVATVHVTLTGSSASPFPVTLPNRNEFNLSIPSFGASRILISSQGETSAGYGRLSSNIPIYGSALFRTLRNATILSESGVGLSLPARDFTVYIDNNANAVSGYAIANYGRNGANISMTLRNRNGISQVTQSLFLAAGQHIAEFAFQRFPGQVSPGFEGSMEFHSDQELAAVALRYDNLEADVFCTIPVLAGETANILHFPQVADGAGYRTNFILVNPSQETVNSRLEFFDSTGNPLALPIAGSSRFTYEFAVGPKSVVRILTDATSSATKTGWAKVTSNVSLGGSAIFQRVAGSRILSEAGVSSSPLASHFTAYVESLASAQSGLAICNPNAVSVNVTIKLRKADGQAVTTASFSLPPSGHTARFFTQWFPKDTEQFWGTLEVLATMPVSAIALRYDNPEQNVFAASPIIPIP